MIATDPLPLLVSMLTDIANRLVERHEPGDRNFYPLDFDAQRTAEGYRFAVTLRSPEPRL